MSDVSKMKGWKEIMSEKLKNLIDVKSIVTIVFTLVFAVLALTKVISGEDFMTTFLIIITYYFTKNANDQKKE